MKRAIIIYLCIFVFMLSFTGCKFSGHEAPQSTGETSYTGTVEDPGSQITENGEGRESNESSKNSEDSKNKKNRENEENSMLTVSSNKSESLSKANNRFAWSIFKELNKEDADRNIFISPLSITSALGMALNGAEGSTKEAMETALGYKGMMREEINSGYKYLLERLKALDEKIKLNISNSIWIRDSFPVRQEFIDLNRDAYSAEIEVLNFNSPDAADTINNWIDDATEGLISKMIEPPIDPRTIMYLINAIYFKGIWSTQFDPGKTFDGTFHKYGGGNQSARMMDRKGEIEYLDEENYKAIRMPYGDGKTAMYCILPDEGEDINTFISEFTEEEWGNLKSGLLPMDDLIVQIPKFKMEYGIKELNSALTALGMGEAFQPVVADFSGIADDVWIDAVLHKAVIEVNEEGSEAAAVTVVEMRTTAIVEPITFIADRPFLFIIADDEEGTILFMGKLVSVK